MKENVKIKEGNIKGKKIKKLGEIYIRFLFYGKNYFVLILFMIFILSEILKKFFMKNLNERIFFLFLILLFYLILTLLKYYFWTKNFLRKNSEIYENLIENFFNKKPSFFERKSIGKNFLYFFKFTQ